MKIVKVLKNSIADELGVSSGDILLYINKNKIDDLLDYGYYTASNDFSLEIKKPDNEIWELEIEKDDDEELGIVFEECIEDSAKRCSNKCIFCFIDQLPKDMRKTLYFKDDDTRMSFLHGNYVTLTNTKDEDIDKVIRYRMSPINISVHTTNPTLRVEMMGNKKAKELMPIIKKLINNNIDINCQIVLCKGINDGIELEKSIKDLLALGEHMNSLSIVPVGITKHRDGLKTLEEFDNVDAIKIINTVESYQLKMLSLYDRRKIYLADEFYLKANKELPTYEEYDDFPQIENGVGMMRAFYDEALERIENIKEAKIKGEKLSIATGALAYSYIKDLSERISGKLIGLSINVYRIKNEFFGESVTVAGLLTGNDIILQLKDKDLGETLFISNSMIKADEKILLDDITIDMIGNELGVEIITVKNDGLMFVESIIKDVYILEEN